MGFILGFILGKDNDFDFGGSLFEVLILWYIG